MVGTAIIAVAWYFWMTCVSSAAVNLGRNACCAPASTAASAEEMPPAYPLLISYWKCTVFIQSIVHFTSALHYCNMDRLLILSLDGHLAAVG